MVVIDKTYTVEITQKEAELITEVLAGVVREKAGALKLEDVVKTKSHAELEKIRKEIDDLRKVRNCFGFLSGTTFYGD